eukprot:TRINITY_DN17328_c0_g1_i1.p1 TRINITY_DN17328_c0_g1~~TRINITY_DN17328_c0_g1_i1.p1  ORF type:complete len:149 (+),score=10.18 TRINITY_DN17328_c0_g1_i1:298-744(+)
MRSSLRVEIENGFITNGIGCLVLLICNKLKNQSFLCPEDAVLHPVDLALPEKTNGTVLFSLWWKESPETKDSDLVEVKSCCEKCGEIPLAFRCKSFTFSSSGKASVPITFKCSPFHGDRPKGGSLFLRVKFLDKSNTIKVKRKKSFDS